MANSLNTVALSGNLAQAAIRLGNNQGIGFTIAVNRSVKDASGQWGEAVSFIPVTAWGNYDGLFVYLTKGQPVNVQGRLQQNKYNDKNGIERNDVHVIAYSIQLLYRSGQAQQGQVQQRQAQQGQAQQGQGQASSLKDDIPF